MKIVFRSKIGLELVIPIVLIFGVVLFFTINQNPSWSGIIIQILVFAFVVHLFSTTKYTIENENLKIKCGFIVNKTIDIQTIKKISETNNPLSSPATSLDRLEIFYGKYNSVIISPKLKKEFIEAIVSLNSSVEVEFRKK